MSNKMLREEKQQVRIDLPVLPAPSRKRGRPRKTHLLLPSGKALRPQKLDHTRRPRHKKINSSLSSCTDNSFIGQTVHGMLDGSFDAGYLLTVRVGDTETVLRGVVFEPGFSVPISKENDIAPNVKMIKREVGISPLPEGPRATSNAASLALPSTHVPVLPAPVCVANGQAPAVATPNKIVHPVEAGLAQTNVATFLSNVSPMKYSPVDPSVNSCQEHAYKAAEPVCQVPKPLSHSVEAVETQVDVNSVS